MLLSLCLPSTLTCATFPRSIKKRRTSAVKKLAEYEEACEADRLYEESCRLGTRADFMPREPK